MEKKNKIACSIIAGLFIFSYVIGLIPFYIETKQDDKIERIILISLDSCNPEYLSPDYMPKLYWLLKEEGVIYKHAWAPIAAETMNGHTTMLTGCLPNKTGIIGNGYHDSVLSKDDQPENPVQDPEHRFVKTIFERLEKDHRNKARKTAFISGKWRLPDFLAYGAEYVFASPVCKEFEVTPPGYAAKVGSPITFGDGDIYDQWIMRSLTEVVKNDDPEFIFVNLAWLDVSGHDGGSMNLNHRRELQQLDDMIWQFMLDLKAMRKYDTTLFIFTADHGMNTINEVFSVDTYLEDQGIEVDFVHGEGHSAFIFLEDHGDMARAANKLKESDKVAVVLPRNEMWRLSLDTKERRTGQIYISCKENVAVSYKGFTITAIGTHGGISARDVPMALMGPKIKKGEFIQNKIPGLEDVAPTIYDLMGYDVPDYMQGRILNETYS